MKIKLLNIVSISTILFLVTACGGGDSSTPDTNTNVSISVEKASGQNVYFSKTSNVDLEIVSMKVDVYKTDDEADTDPSDNILINTKALTQDTSAWKGTLTALEKESIYIFHVTARNASDQEVSHGTTTQKIETGVSNDVAIKLAQSTGLFDDADSVPTVSNLSASKDANGNIALSFNIKNPNEESVTWKLFEDGGTSLSTEFAVNTGTTSNVSEAVSVVYTKDTNSNNTDYVLELKSTEGEIRYAFNINFEGEEVTVNVNTPPIIESLNIVVEGDTLTITPVLDKESNAVTYAWSFDDSYDEIITNPTDKTVVITGYNEDSDLELKLEVLENGASSYRVYTIRGHSNRNVQLIDTSKQEVLDILGVSKVEADALLAFYKSTNMASNSDFDTWNTLTHVSDWQGVTVENDVITQLNLPRRRLTGSIPTELGNLGSLERLYLSYNQLTGSIPSELGNLGSLTFLSLTNNQLTGSIPSELGNLTSLEGLYLYDNQLTGSIPTELENLSSLEILDLDFNQLTGSIPTELGNLNNLEKLYLDNNQLTGSLPLSFAQLGGLKYLDVSNNPLSGVISDQGFMTFLNALSTFIFNNTELSIQGVTSD